MNLFSLVCDRVYINIGETYDEHREILDHLDMMTLIYEVAKANPNGDVAQLYDNTTDKVFEGRTKAFIVRKVEVFIADMYEKPCIDENMATFASKKQLNNLIRAFDSGKKRVSCYGLVYLYVMYTLLEGKSSVASDCAAFLIALHKLVLNYFEDNPNDQLAIFFHGCFDPIIKAVKENNINLTNKKLPSRPRKHPKDTND